MSSLQYPFPDAPPAGDTLEVAAGECWISMPLPFQLDHINLWWIADTIIDTGIGDEAIRALREKILPGGQVTRAILTHYHPDHAGNAAWLCAPSWCPSFRCPTAALSRATV